MLSQSIKQSLIVLTALLLLWGPFQAWLLNAGLSIDWDIAFIDGELTALFLGVVGFIITNTLTYYIPERKQIPFLILGVLIVAYFALVATEFSIQSVINYPVDYLADFHLQRLTYMGLIATILLAVAWHQTAKKSTTEDDERRVATEKMARDAELASLRQQLQPHFLFNSLNSINALIGTQPEKARKMVQQLSDFLRGTIKKDDSQLVPLTEELQQLRLYLEIEKVRFGHRLSTHIDSDNVSLQSKLPPLLIQPVVENAIKFGLYDTVGETLISIQTSMNGNQLLIKIENPFDANTATPRQGTGFGLSSLQRRLYLLYARNDLLTTTQQEKTFITQIRIPQSK